MNYQPVLVTGFVILMGMKLSWSSYVRYLRRKPAHVQHVHGIVFASVLTVICASVILYTQYDVFKETYVKEEPVATEEGLVTQSPGESFSGFLAEGRDRLLGIMASTSLMFADQEADYVRGSTE